jgi:hypothetical protein
MYLIWKDSRGNCHKVGELLPDLFEYLSGDDLNMALAKQNGFKGYPAFSMVNRVHKNPLPTFIRRCMPRNRRDFCDYLSAFGLDASNKEVRDMPDFALLGYTGARLTANPFCLVAEYF